MYNKAGRVREGVWAWHSETRLLYPCVAGLPRQGAESVVVAENFQLGPEKFKGTIIFLNKAKRFVVKLISSLLKISSPHK